MQNTNANQKEIENYMLRLVCKLKTKMEYIETTLPPCLNKALSFQGKKVREGKGNKT